jgi:hypothetical protein
MCVINNTLKETAKKQENNITNNKDIVNGKDTIGRKMTSNPKLQQALTLIEIPFGCYILGFYVDTLCQLSGSGPV